MPSHEQVCHIWAQQNGQDSKGHNVFSIGTRLYSYGYHFVIGRFISDNVVLMNDDSYSVSTSKHQSYARRALSGVTLYYVPNPDANSKAEHRANYQAYTDKAADSMERAARAWKYTSFYLDDAQRRYDEAFEYSKLFKLGYRKKDLPDLDTLTAKAAKQKAKRAAAAKKYNKGRAAALVKIRRLVPASLAAWYVGETFKHDDFDLMRKYNIPLREVMPGGDRLRIKPGKPDTVETNNQRAEVPLAHITKAWPLIQRFINKGKEFTPNGHTIKLGHFAIDRISEDGTVKAGCHTFSKAEILRFAKVLGLI